MGFASHRELARLPDEVELLHSVVPRRSGGSRRHPAAARATPAMARGHLLLTLAEAVGELY